ncbi:short chain dehydrogenase [Leptospira hartskeerlii]|uniref:Short chain dehydrogenase n=1 Tax=Leptospira hartskeerlii TaxID=2023177 RepID=A0A2M9XA86_9LEPT|nr:SDR family oxidoreductase [Leptospira hartskeerlii]PJZ24611.1 short chain dehydrogenase [Leptospira hartskeerlii]PJZ33013.1 short chain dehydrogenase [Leptospira hartskeerlii]
MNSFFKDKVVWITGASSGIGEALASELKDSGARLILSARRKEELIRVKNKLGKTDEDCLVLPFDLENYSSMESLPDQAILKFGKVDVLINNGGISQRSLAHETSISAYESLLKVNFLGNIGLTIALLPHFRKRKKGWVVSISSVAGKFGVPLRTGYSATKFALTGFYEALRAENSPNNLKVLLVYPGFVKTKISKNALSGNGSKHGKMDNAILKGIDPKECATEILNAIVSEKNEVIIAGTKERFGIFLHKYFPKLFAIFLTKASVT